MAGRKRQPHQLEETALTAATPADELRALIHRVQDGDEKARPQLRKALLAIDDRAVLARIYAPPDEWARRLTVESITGKDSEGAAEVMLRTTQLLAVELAGASPTPIENVLCARIALAWLICAQLDAWLANVQKASVAAKVREYHEKSAARADRRPLAACKALATVRSLALPVLQVNVARKQVNVAAANPPRPDAGPGRIEARA